MLCLLCGKELNGHSAIVKSSNGTPRKVSFCCYEHYVKFWDGATGFIPLPEYNKDGPCDAV